MSTHAFARQGPGGTTALASTQIGADIVMPAGGPWLIHDIWAQVVKATTIPDQGTAGILHIQSLSGDMRPDPAPGKYPIIGSCVSESANVAISAVPLNLWPVHWEAAGKASLRLNYIQQLAMTTASEVACGIISELSSSVTTFRHRGQAPTRRPLERSHLQKKPLASSAYSPISTKVTLPPQRRNAWQLSGSTPQT